MWNEAFKFQNWHKSVLQVFFYDLYAKSTEVMTALFEEHTERAPTICLVI